MYPPQLQNEYPDIPWKSAAGMRDKLMHHYFGVDYEAVYETIRVDLPAIRPAIVSILSKTEIPAIPKKGRTKKKKIS